MGSVVCHRDPVLNNNEGTRGIPMICSVVREPLARTLLCFAAIFPGAAAATNGFNFFGFGAESVGVGGADVALVRDTSALVINPAGLGHIDGRQADVQLDPYHTIDVRHSDSLGNDDRSTPREGGFGSLAYAQRLGSTNLHAGAGIYVAGGLGFGYDDLDSGFGTTGDIANRFNIFRLAPGIAWNTTKGLTLGASLSLNYAMARQKFFPESSVLNPLDLQQSLFGSRIDGLKGFGAGVNVGLRYALGPSEDWIFGLAYRSKSKIDLHGGTLTVNYDALGAGKITYRDVTLDGVVIPQDVQAGVMFKPTKKWKLLGEVTWIDWSSAIREFHLNATEPERNPLPLVIMDEIDQRQELRWRDQFVMALGIMYEPSANWRASAGFNYGRQPVPRRNLTPLIAAIPEKHFTLGAGRRIGDKWDVQIGVTYIGKTSVDYQNPSTRISADARETHETVALSLGMSRTW